MGKTEWFSSFFCANIWWSQFFFVILRPNLPASARVCALERAMRII